MVIQLPIEIDFSRPMKRPESPYRQCNNCHFVGDDVKLGGKCPKCGQVLQPYGPRFWPNPEFNEIWDDVIFAYNNKRSEIAAIGAAIYFEAGVFDLLYWGYRWIHPTYQSIGMQPIEFRKAEERISQQLSTIKNRWKTDKALEDVFGADTEGMLANVLGQQYDLFWKSYEQLSNWRNPIVHRGLRAQYTTLNAEIEEEGAETGEQLSKASVHFIPICWDVHSHLWNEYIHKPMLARKK